MKRIILLTAISIIYWLPCLCQGDSIPETGKLYLDFQNLNFIRDDEYSNPVIEGYTLTGFFIQPSFVYSPSQKIILKLGAHLLGYSGTNKISLFKPVVSTTFNISRGLSLVVGTLSGSNTHRMLDPHFNKERFYNEYSEDGIQVRFENNHIFNDTWVSWEHFIFNGDTTRERFTAGESFNWVSEPVGDLFRVEIPVQLQFKHYGGQISNYTEQVETYFNSAAGISIISDLKANKRSDIGLSYVLFNGKCLTRNAPSGIESGHGSWYRMFAGYGIFQFEAGYWRSHNFYAPNGNFIFSSVSEHLPGVIISDRKIITCSAGISARPGNIADLYFGFDGFYDTGLRKFDTAFTLHLKFGKMFRIADISP